MSVAVSSIVELLRQQFKEPVEDERTQKIITALGTKILPPLLRAALNKQATTKTDELKTALIGALDLAISDPIPGKNQELVAASVSLVEWAAGIENDRAEVTKSLSFVVAAAATAVAKAAGGATEVIISPAQVQNVADAVAKGISIFSAADKKDTDVEGAVVDLMKVVVGRVAGSDLEIKKEEIGVALKLGKAARGKLMDRRSPITFNEKEKTLIFSLVFSAVNRIGAAKESAAMPSFLEVESVLPVVDAETVQTWMANANAEEFEKKVLAQMKIKLT